MLESREPDAVQVETPDNHVGVETEGREEVGREDKEEERGLIAGDISWSLYLNK